MTGPPALRLDDFAIEEEASSSPGGDETTGDIVVTAQRREQRLQEAPVAVTALSEGALDQLNVQDTRDLMTAVPSLQVSTQSGGDSGGSSFPIGPVTGAARPLAAPTTPSRTVPGSPTSSATVRI